MKTSAPKPKKPRTRKPRKGSPPGRKPGRPLELTTEIADVIVRCLRAGLSVQEAADVVGFDRATIQEWRRRGKEDPAAPAVCAYLNAGWTKAKPIGKLRIVEAIDRLGVDRWHVATDDDIRAAGYNPSDPESRAQALQLLPPRFVPGNVVALKFRAQTQFPDAFTEPSRIDVNHSGEVASSVDVRHPDLERLPRDTLLALAYPTLYGKGAPKLPEPDDDQGPDGAGG